MRIFKTSLLVFCFVCTGFTQNTIEKNLQKFNDESVPYITMEEIKEHEVTLLDTRTKSEFEVSHLKGAVWVGYRTFNIDSIVNSFPQKNTPIVVYCSIGVRSEDIGEQLIKAGYRDVKNLYGGIFAWKNKGNPVYNLNKKETDSIHAFSKQWGKLLTKGKKVYPRDDKL